MRTWTIFLTTVIFAASVIPNLVFQLGKLGYLLQFMVSMPLLLYATARAVHNRAFTARTRRAASIGLLVLVAILGLHYMTQIWQGVRGGLTMRAIVYPLSAGIFLIIVPNVLPRRAFLIATSIISTSLIAIATIVLLTGGITISGVVIPQWPGSETVSIASITAQYPKMSGIVHPNTLAQWAFFGFCSGLYLASAPNARERHAGWMVLAAALTGLVFAFSRAALLTAAAAAIVFLLVNERYRRAGVAVFTATLAGVSWVLAVVTGLLPGPNALTSIQFEVRQELWTATLTVASEHLLVGVGPISPPALLAGRVSSRAMGLSPHNSYLTILATTGLIGLIGYLLIHFDAARAVFAAQPNRATATFASLLSGILVQQLFDNFMILGLNSRSAMAAAIVGYCLTATSETRQPRTRLETIYADSTTRRFLTPSPLTTISVDVSESWVCRTLRIAWEHSGVRRAWRHSKLRELVK